MPTREAGSVNSAAAGLRSLLEVGFLSLLGTNGSRLRDPGTSSLSKLSSHDRS